MSLILKQIGVGERKWAGEKKNMIWWMLGSGEDNKCYEPMIIVFKLLIYLCPT